MQKGYTTGGLLIQLLGAAGCSPKEETTFKDAWSMDWSHVSIQRRALKKRYKAKAIVDH